jgi:hypothetical protein
MQRLYRLCLAILISIGVSSAARAGAETAYLSILTGPASGTYYDLGSDVSRLLFPQIDLEVIETLQPLHSLMSLSVPSDFQLAIVQIDALQSELGEALGADRVRLVMPLHLEEVHLLAGPDIKSPSDLNGKRVSVGIHGSGTNITADALLDRLGINPARKLYLREWRALMALDKGEIDAMFYVIGAPARFLAANVAELGGAHLVPIELAVDDPSYPALEIPPRTYRWQEESVRTVGVRAWLISSDLSLDDPDCEQVGRLVLAIRDNLDLLRQSGHEKWKQVELEERDLRSHPRVSECVLRALDSPAP